MDRTERVVRRLSRRQFLEASLALAGLGLLSGCGLAPTPAPPKVHRIGYLGVTPEASAGARLFIEGLNALGWADGQNVHLEYRWGGGRNDRYPDLAAELVGLGVDLIVVPTAPAAQAAKQATSTIPIVLSAVGDPVELGLVASLQRPGGNITGVSSLFPQLVQKRLELLRESVPRLKRVAVLWNSNPGTIRGRKEAEEAAQSLGLQLRVYEVDDPAQLEGVFEAAMRDQAGALLELGGPFANVHLGQIVDLASKSRLPATYARRDFVDAGGLMSYGARLPDLYRRTATYVDKILKGVKPADLPVEQPTTFDFIINLKTAQALGLTIPESVFLQATEVIE